MRRRDRRLQPTPSRMEASATKLLGEVKGKEYSQAATGVTPAAERAEVSSSTWASSSWATYLRLL